jgi:hypothetical protein
VGIDAQECFTQSDEVGNMQDGISCELMQLHAVIEKKPTKKFVGRERETAKEIGKKHHPESPLWRMDDLGAGEDDLN